MMLLLLYLLVMMLLLMLSLLLLNQVMMCTSHLLMHVVRVVQMVMRKVGWTMMSSGSGDGVAQIRGECDGGGER